jgi:phospho-N-acetylmuramoyl-pentapeptide-transferase
LNAFLNRAPLLVPFAAFLVTLAVMPAGIRWLHRLKFGQNIRDDGPQAHMSKSGTPTMGGIIFIPLALAFGLLYEMLHGLGGGRGIGNLSWALAAFTFAGMSIGWLDDYRSIRGGRSLGLKAREKMAMQVLVSAVFLLAVHWITAGGPPANILQAARGESAVDWAGSPSAMPFRWLLLLIVTVWLINSANIADGLDGLASAQAVVAILALMLWRFPSFIIGGAPAGVFLAFSMVACLLAFLWFNGPPARVFMGDTGSIALGCFVAGLGMITVPLWVLLLITGMWSLESLSVVIQVLYFKATGGKRIFRMAPIHHHFELAGWPETAVTLRFVIASVLLGLFLPALVAGFLR